MGIVFLSLFLFSSINSVKATNPVSVGDVFIYRMDYEDNYESGTFYYKIVVTSVSYDSFEASLYYGDTYAELDSYASYDGSDTFNIVRDLSNVESWLNGYLPGALDMDQLTTSELDGLEYWLTEDIDGPILDEATCSITDCGYGLTVEISDADEYGSVEVSIHILFSEEGVPILAEYHKK